MVASMGACAGLSPTVLWLMTRARVAISLVGLVIAGCGGAPRAAAPVNPAMMELPPVAPGDPAAEGAPYLALVAHRLAPEWLHFLDDCRLRLPAEHPLNSISLEATATVVIDRAGAIASITVAASGSADFDAAVREVLAAASPLPAPPSWLVSDDDNLHLSWRFARDARQAGAAGARVLWLEEPAPQVVERRLAAGDLEGAARRVSRLGDAEPELKEIARRVLLWAVAAGLRSGDTQAQRAAVQAVQRAALRQLAPELVALAKAEDPALRGEVAAALAQLGEPSTGPVLLELLAGARQPELAATLARALQAMGLAVAAEAAVHRLLAAEAPAQLAGLAALAELPISPALAAQVTKAATARDPLVRGALCRAVAHAKVAPSVRWEIIGKGMGDRDGSARAACTATLAHGNGRPLPWMRAALVRLMADRDQRVRAAAIAAILRWEPTKLDDRRKALAAEVDAQVRAAAVPALARRGDLELLRALLGDIDPLVRRAAVRALLPLDEAKVRELAARDADARVRLVALEGAGELGAVLRLLAEDESAEVRTEVEILRVARRGETVQNGLLRMAGVGVAPAERVRIALAWLLAV